MSVFSNVILYRDQQLFRCKACCEPLRLAGCDEFALSASQLQQLTVRPPVLLICENLVSVLSLPRLEGVLAIHGGGFAVNDLSCVGWICATPLLYWGDLDSNGFAILDTLRSFAPHARSVMMDTATLQQHLDLCAEEPTPAKRELTRLTGEEHRALDLLAAVDDAHPVRNRRLEQERIEWQWACDKLAEALRSVRDDE